MRVARSRCVGDSVVCVESVWLSCFHPEQEQGVCPVFRDRVLSIMPVPTLLLDMVRELVDECGRDLPARQTRRTW